ncbi:MAG: hypothetical protein EBZ51_09120 [Synechococcaceae bacterium WB9_2_112]|nr:hypothetical protein [Synechococcaceae bacterium WB9_2_112]
MDQRRPITPVPTHRRLQLTILNTESNGDIFLDPLWRDNPSTSDIIKLCIVKCNGRIKIKINLNPIIIGKGDLITTSVAVCGDRSNAENQLTILLINMIITQFVGRRINRNTINIG